MRLPTYIYGLVYPAFLGSFLFGALTTDFPDRFHIWAAVLMMIYFAAQFCEGAIFIQKAEAAEVERAWRHRLSEVADAMPADAPGPAALQAIETAMKRENEPDVAARKAATRRSRHIYSLLDAAIDMVEILMMVGIMGAIGLFGIERKGLAGYMFDPREKADHWWMIVAAFALPPIFRLIASWIGHHPDRRSHDVKAHGRLTLLSLTAAAGAGLGHVAPALGLGLITLALAVYLAFFIGWPHIGEGLVREWRSRR